MQPVGFLHAAPPERIVTQCLVSQFILASSALLELLLNSVDSSTTMPSLKNVQPTACLYFQFSLASCLPSFSLIVSTINYL
jgi:hypothetical protein